MIATLRYIEYPISHIPYHIPFNRTIHIITPQPTNDARPADRTGSS